MKRTNATSGGMSPATKKLLLYYVAPFALLAVSTIAVVVIVRQSGNRHEPADKKLHMGIRHLVGKYPPLKPLYDDAMSDRVLTIGEASDINEEAKRLKGN